MKEYNRASAINTFTLIQEELYNTTRPSNIILEELIEVIRFLEERIQELEEYSYD